MALISADTPALESSLIRPAIDYERVKWLGRELLLALGEDPDRPGLIDTPRRWADMWREFLEYQPGRLDTLFESICTDQMVVVSGMRVWSMCEHHLMPFWADVAIAYIAREQVLGLSKFGRIAHMTAHRLQLQEQFVHQIADQVETLTASPDVAILAVGEHLCMTARGIATPHRMTSSVMRGVFRDKPEARAELMSVLQLARAS